jgi:hypothetical protein
MIQTDFGWGESSLQVFIDLDSLSLSWTQQFVCWFQPHTRVQCIRWIPCVSEGNQMIRIYSECLEASLDLNLRTYSSRHWVEYLCKT